MVFLRPLIYVSSILASAVLVSVAAMLAAEVAAMLAPAVRSAAGMLERASMSAAADVLSALAYL